MPKQRTRDKDPQGYQYKLRRANPRRYLWRGAKSLARRTGTPFDLEPDDITMPTHCPVLGIPLVIADGRQQDNSPSLDRIDYRKGYVKGNVEVISWKANRIKSNATIEELMKVAVYYVEKARNTIAAENTKKAKSRGRREVV